MAVTAEDDSVIDLLAVPDGGMANLLMATLSIRKSARGLNQRCQPVIGSAA